ncbi:hypothetical protein BFC22_11735 [Carnobacterium divergens]|uniref:hypothetical protein n=1 Tax=Carnobacterium divergens TaxID=2748 RepID=UPI000E734D2F|nr:hypothetical protein [Carnobacterium divergens]AOA00715.1 hypothetical protein BFC22_11735 [Carnobacterium divergens]
MNKEDILAYLSKQQKRTEIVMKLEKRLNQKRSIYLHAKKQWNGTIVALLIFSWLMTVIPSNSTMISVILIIVATVLAFIKFKRTSASSQEIRDTEQLLEKEMSKPEYIDGLQDFPIKFYDYYSIYRLYQLVKENRATTLHDSFNLLENQLNVEYQNHLAEQNLLTTQATERSARIAAVSSVVTTYNTTKK